MNDSAEFLIRPFPEWGHRVRAAFTLRHGGGASSGAYADLNLGFRAGDNPETPAATGKRSWPRPGWRESPWSFRAWSTATGWRMGTVHGSRRPIRRRRWYGSRTDPCFSVRTGDADAVWAHSPERVLAVTMADCLTALIFDPACGTIAAVHAGWRGTQAHILEKTLRMLADAGRIRPDTPWWRSVPACAGTPWRSGRNWPAAWNRSSWSQEGRFHFDMPASNRAQALACGIPAANLRDMGGDTRLEPERYFSYRRDGQASGRMAAFISLV